MFLKLLLFYTADNSHVLNEIRVDFESADEMEHSNQALESESSEMNCLGELLSDDELSALSSDKESGDNEGNPHDDYDVEDQEEGRN